MEKSVSVSENKSKVSNNNLHIPYDLSLSILSKLPLKSLKRFGCVHKSWSLLFENPHFMNMLRTHFSSNNRSDQSGGDSYTYLLPHVPGLLDDVLYLLPDERYENRIKLDFSPLLIQDAYDPYILSSASINGIFCVGQDTSIERVQSVLWNPATSEFMLIPPSPYESVPYPDPYFNFDGFGYDCVRDDYKVIRCIVFGYDPLFEIYSLRCNSWKILDVNMPDIAHYAYDLPRLGKGVYIDGVCHWWGSTSIYPPNSTNCLVSFDFCNEVLFTTPMLVDIDERCDFVIERCLVVLNDSIALISNYLNATTFHISILTEPGVKESWIKLFIIGPMPLIERPIGVGKKGNICFKRKDDELVWFDLSTQIIDEIGVKGDEYARMGIYKASLLPIRGINT